MAKVFSRNQRRETQCQKGWAGDDTRATDWVICWPGPAGGNRKLVCQRIKGVAHVKAMRHVTQGNCKVMSKVGKQHQQQQKMMKRRRKGYNTQHFGSTVRTYRVDIMAYPGEGNRVLRALQRRVKAWGWTVRKHISAAERWAKKKRAQEEKKQTQQSGNGGDDRDTRE